MTIDSFIRYLQFEKRYSTHTLLAYRQDLESFVAYLETNFKLESSVTATRNMVRSWIVKLIEQGMTSTTVNRKISTLKSYYNYLLREGLIELNPIHGIVSLKKPERIAVTIEEEELSRTMDEAMGVAPSFSAYRDRLVVELLYATGMRRGELVGLQVASFDAFQSTIKVRGKRNKERIIPLSKQMTEQLLMYLDIRNKTFNQSCDFLIVTNSGKPAYPGLVYQIVRKSLSSTVSKRKSPHVLRHSFATHMLSRGADLNTIKELLGHASLAATQVYTHSTLGELQTIYYKAHPRAKLK